MWVQNTDNQKLKVSYSTPISSLTFGLCIALVDVCTYDKYIPTDKLILGEDWWKSNLDVSSKTNSVSKQDCKISSANLAS